MKKILFAAAVAMMALSSCGSKEAKTDAEAPATEATEQAAPATESTEGAVSDLTDDTAYRPDTKVESLVVLDFNATWCGPCKMLKPVFEAAAAKYVNVKFISVDIEKCPDTATAFGVEAVPTVVFLSPAGMETFVGTEDLLPAEKFDALVQKYL